MSRSVVVLFGAVCLCSVGCGTFSDAMCGPVNDHVYYRGVRLDIQAAKEGMVLMLADIPFSAIADTLLIPHYARLHSEAEANRRRRMVAGSDTPPKTDDGELIRPATRREPE